MKQKIFTFKKDMTSRKIRSRKIRSRKIRSRKIRSRKIRSRKIRSRKIRSRKKRRILRGGMSETEINKLKQSYEDLGTLDPANNQQLLARRALATKHNNELDTEIRNMKEKIPPADDNNNELSRRDATLLHVRLSEEMPPEIKLENLINAKKVVTNYINKANRLIVSQNTIPGPYDDSSSSTTDRAFGL